MAEAAGFDQLAALSRTAVKRAFGRTPGELRKKGGAQTDVQLVLRLALRPPYDWAQVSGFLAARAVPGLEFVDERGYFRAFGGGVLRVFPLDERALELELPEAAGASDLDRAAARVRRVFDLDADPHEVALVLDGDGILRRSVRARPGLRVPGAWDGFELAVLPPSSGSR